MLHTAPKVLKTQATFTIKQGTVFRHAIAPYFYVEQGKLTYELKDSPNWLSINSQTGSIIGKAPLVYTAKTYQVTVIARNFAGNAEWTFYITVTREDFSHQVDAVIQRYLDNKAQQQKEASYVPQLLEYLYQYFMQLKEHQEEFLALLREKAKEKGMTLKAKPTYQDFAKVITAINPEINRQLGAELPPNSSLPHAPVSANDLQNLFRQGSQQLGVHPVPVFNYFAAPTQHVWSVHVKNILNAATVAVMERQQANQRQQVQHSAETQPQKSVHYHRPQPS